MRDGPTWDAEGAVPPSVARLARFPVALLAASLLLAPSLLGGFYVDDWFFLAKLEGLGVVPPSAPWDLFSFDSGGTEFPGGVQGSFLPWWTSPEFRGHFFRPLSSLSHALDHWIWGRFAAGHHLTSWLLWLGLVAAAHRLFEAVRPGTGRGPLTVGFASLLFALDETHTWPVYWLANRNALLVGIACCFGVAAHLRARRGEAPAWQSWAWLALGFAFGEACVAGVAFVVAYEVLGARDAPRRRAAAAVPAVLLTLAYLVAWKLGGFGTSGSGMYIDPLDDPARFVGWALPTRLPLLVLSAFTPIQAESTFLLTDPQQLALGIGGWLLVAPLAWLLAGHLARDLSARWLAAGALLAMVPVCATFPAGRLLVLPSVAAAWVLAGWTVDCFARGRRWLGYGLLGTHVVLAPAVALLGAALFVWVGSGLNRDIANMELPEELPEDARVLLLDSPTPFVPLYVRIQRAVRGQAGGAAIWPTNALPSDLEFRRTGPARFTLSAPAPGFLTTPFEKLVYPGARFEPGQAWRSGGLEVQAVEVLDGQLRTLQFTVDRPLDDPTVLLLAWDGQRMASFELPKSGCAVLRPSSGNAVLDAFRWPSSPGACGER